MGQGPAALVQHALSFARHAALPQQVWFAVKSLQALDRRRLPCALTCPGTVGVVLMKLLLFLYCRGSRSPAVQASAAQRARLL